MQLADEMTEIFLPGDVKPGVATGLLDKNTGTLLLNLEGDSPEDIANDPNTPKMFQDLEALEILRPEIKQTGQGGGQIELPEYSGAGGVRPTNGLPDQKEAEDARIRQILESNKAEEHAKLEQLHQEATGAKLYQPYFPTQ